MIQIHQALWGYSSGHHLLASSVSLSSQSLKILEPLTDLSGSETVIPFDGYLTGCYLPADGYYALSKTWYAPEMPRQGCAWTHTLLIKDDSSSSWDNKQIDELFHKPDINSNEWEKEYYKPLFLQSCANSMGEIYSNEFTMPYKVLSILTSYTDPVIVADTGVERINEAIELLIGAVGISFFRDISFCTGSFSNRTINRVQLDFQIVPSNLFKMVSRTSQKGTALFDSYQDVMNSNEFLVKTDPQKEFNDVKHFICFCNKEYYRRAYWILFEKLYRSTKNFQLLSVANIKNMLQKQLGENEMNVVVPRIFDYIFDQENLYTNQSPKDVVHVLFDFLTQANWPENYKSISNTLDKLWLEYHAEMVSMLPLLMNCDLSDVGENAVEHLASIISLDDYAQLLIQNANECLPVLRFNYKLALCSKIWMQSESYQIEVLRELRNFRNGSDSTISLCTDIIFQIFETSSYSLSRELYDAFKDDSIIAFFNYFDSNNSDFSKLQLWSPLCSSNQGLAISKLKSVSNPKLFIATISVLDPYSIDLAEIPPKTWETYFRRFSSSYNRKDFGFEYAQFVLPIILKSDSPFSKDFLQFAFQTVHSMLADDKMPYARWEKLSKLLPEIAWYNSWDKCKRLRKAAKQRKYNISFDLN